MVKAKKSEKPHRVRRWLLGIFATSLILVLAIHTAFQLSPWPSALLLRAAFADGANKKSKALEKYVPSDVSSIKNIQYKSGDKNAFLDVYYPTNTPADTNLPTIFWVHGGGWISGSKDNIANYLKILAGKGYTTVGVDYSIAPEAHYPTPVIEVNEALGYLNQHADELHIDKNQLVLAGDSAGSQIASQIAAMTTNSAYAALVGVTPSLAPQQIKGILLNCGAYDLAIINTDSKSEGAKILQTFLWAYSGRKDFMDDPQLAQASVINYVTKDFPPTFITAGNADPLLPQSQAMAQKLTSLGIPQDQLFYPSDYSPPLPHEYQFVLDTSAGQEALQHMTSFMQQYTDSPLVQ